MKEEQTTNDLMKEWEVFTFGEIIDFLTDYQANGSFAGLKENVRYYSDKNFAVLVRLKDLRHELQNSNEFVYTDEQGYNFLKKSRVKEGDILVANVGAGVGTTLKMPKFEGYATLGPNMFRVDLKSNILPKFFLAFSNSMNYWHQLKLVSAGSGQPKINKAQYRSIKIPIPRVEIQYQIVAKIEELFSELDKGVEELNTVQQQLKVYRQAVLKWAFEGKLTSSKEEWKRVRLGDVAFAVDPQPSHRTPPKVDGGVPYVSTKDFDYEQDKIDFSDARLVSPTVLDEHLERYQLEEGDFVIGKIGTIGKPVRIVLPQNYTLSANIVLIQPRKINRTYLYYFFQSNFIEKEFQSGAKA
ncbi:MAG: hypothetical protein EOO10_20865, partial [Chitinophagaceae bacterium]